MRIVSFSAGIWAANTYVIGSETPADGNSGAVIIDPGLDSFDQIQQILVTNSWTPGAVFLTHGHLDHVGEAHRLINDAERSEMAPPGAYIHPADEFMLTDPVAGLSEELRSVVIDQLGTDRLPKLSSLRYFSDNQTLTSCGFEFHIRHLPGHSPGCVVIETATEDDTRVLFSGDVLFAGSIGRMDLAGGSEPEMKTSLRRLVAEIDAETVVLPGHGSATLMSHELSHNPYLSEEYLNG